MNKKQKGTRSFFSEGKIKLFPRKCSNCGCGMDEGYILNDVDYFCSNKCISVNHNPPTPQAVELEECYWTSWNIEDCEGDELYNKKGEVIECN